MTWYFILSKINNTTYIGAIMDKPQMSLFDKSVVIILAVILLGIAAYLARNDIKLREKRLESFNRFVTVLEKLERTLEEFEKRR